MNTKGSLTYIRACIRRFTLALEMLRHYRELYQSPFILFKTITKRSLVKLNLKLKIDNEIANSIGNHKNSTQFREFDKEKKN